VAALAYFDVPRVAAAAYQDLRPDGAVPGVLVDCAVALVGRVNAVDSVIPAVAKVDAVNPSSLVTAHRDLRPRRAVPREFGRSRHPRDVHPSAPVVAPIADDDGSGPSPID